MNPPDPGDAVRIWQMSRQLQVSFNPNTLVFSLLLFALFIFLCALCSAAEEALVSSSGSRLRQLAEGGDRRAAKVLAAAEDESTFCMAMQNGRICSAVAAAASLAAGCSHPLRDLLVHAGVSYGAGGLSLFITTLLTVLLVLPAGVHIPTAIAGEKPEENALRLIGPANFVRILLTPLNALSRLASNIGLRMAGGDPNAPEDVTEEEIREMVDAGEVNGAIEETEKDMIANILDFNDTTVDEVMTHRTDVIAIEDTMAPAGLVQLAIENGFSRIPVYHEDLDNILGICHIKDYLCYIGTPLPEKLSLISHMGPAYFVPESKKCSELFTEMTERKIQLAVVVDEYGGTAGIISMEDLVESIVGNIQDEYDHEDDAEIQQLSEHSFLVSGSTEMEDIADLTGEEFPESDFDTIAGFIVEQIGTIPKESEHRVVQYRSLTLTVQKVEDRRITSLLLEQDPDWKLEEETSSEHKKDK